MEKIEIIEDLKPQESLADVSRKVKKLEHLVFIKFLLITISHMIFIGVVIIILQCKET